MVHRPCRSRRGFVGRACLRCCCRSWYILPHASAAKGLGEFSFGSGQQAIDRAFGEAKDAGNLLVRAVVIVAQDQDLPHGPWQLVNRLADDLDRVFAVRLIPCVRSSLDRNCSPSRPTHIGGHVSADLCQPGSEPVGLSQFPEIHEGPGKALLGGVLGKLMVRQHAVRDSRHRGAVPLAQLAEAVQIARLRGSYEFDVRCDRPISKRLLPPHFYSTVCRPDRK